MARTQQTQSLHDRIIRLQVDTYKSHGYSNIKAAHIGFPNGQPTEVNGHIPDISASRWQQDDYL